MVGWKHSTEREDGFGVVAFVGCAGKRCRTVRGSWWDGVGGGRADSEMAKVLVTRVVRRGCLIFYRVEIVFFFF